MIRHLIALSLLISTQAYASAFDSLADQELQASAYALLLKNAGNMKIRGDISAGEKLVTIVNEVEEYNQELAQVLMDGGNIETDMKSDIDHTDVKCVKVQSQTAQCDLIILRKPMGETTVRFMVGLNSEGKAASVSDAADVMRGD